MTSIEDFQQGLSRDISSAIDISKFHDIFSSLTKIIQDQNNQIKNLNDYISKVEGRLSSLNDKVDEKITSNMHHPKHIDNIHIPPTFRQADIPVLDLFGGLGNSDIDFSDPMSISHALFEKSKFVLELVPLVEEFKANSEDVHGGKNKRSDFESVIAAMRVSSRPSTPIHGNKSAAASDRGVKSGRHPSSRLDGNSNSSSADSHASDIKSGKNHSSRLHENSKSLSDDPNLSDFKTGKHPPSRLGSNSNSSSDDPNALDFESGRNPSSRFNGNEDSNVSSDDPNSLEYESGRHPSSRFDGSSNSSSEDPNISGLKSGKKPASRLGANSNLSSDDPNSSDPESGKNPSSRLDGNSDFSSDDPNSPDFKPGKKHSSLRDGESDDPNATDIKTGKHSSPRLGANSNSQSEDANILDLSGNKSPRSTSSQNKSKTSNFKERRERQDSYGDNNSGDANDDEDSHDQKFRLHDDNNKHNHSRGDGSDGSTTNFSGHNNGNPKTNGDGIKSSRQRQDGLGNPSHSDPNSSSLVVDYLNEVAANHTKKEVTKAFLNKSKHRKERKNKKGQQQDQDQQGVDSKISSRRKMKASNLSIPKTKLAAICKELRLRGCFLKGLNTLSKEQKKQAAEGTHTIHDQIAALEENVRELNKKVDQQKRSLTRVPLALRSLLPQHFKNNFSKLADILEAIEEVGGIDIILRNIPVVNPNEETLTDMLNRQLIEEGRSSLNELLGEPEDVPPLSSRMKPDSGWSNDSDIANSSGRLNPNGPSNLSDRSNPSGDRSNLSGRSNPNGLSDPSGRASTDESFDLQGIDRNDTEEGNEVDDQDQDDQAPTKSHARSGRRGKESNGNKPRRANKSNTEPKQRRRNTERSGGNADRSGRNSDRSGRSADRSGRNGDRSEGNEDLSEENEDGDGSAPTSNRSRQNQRQRQRNRQHKTMHNDEYIEFPDNYFSDDEEDDVEEQNYFEPEEVLSDYLGNKGNEVADKIIYRKAQNNRKKVDRARDPNSSGVAAKGAGGSRKKSSNDEDDNEMYEEYVYGSENGSISSSMSAPMPLPSLDAVRTMGTLVMSHHEEMSEEAEEERDNQIFLDVLEKNSPPLSQRSTTGSPLLSQRSASTKPDSSRAINGSRVNRDEEPIRFNSYGAAGNSMEDREEIDNTSSPARRALIKKTHKPKKDKEGANVNSVPRRKISEDIMRAIRAQLGPLETLTESKPIMILNEQIAEIREASLTRKDLDDIFFLGQGHLRPFDPHAVKLRAAIMDLMANHTGKELPSHLDVHDSNDGSRDFMNNLEDASKVHSENAKQELVTYKIMMDRKLKAWEDKSKETQMDISELKFNLNTLMTQFEQRIKSSTNMDQEPLTGDINSHDLKSLVHRMYYDFDRQRKKQSTAFAEVSESLEKLQKNMEDRPDKETLEKMMELTEATFKRHLGENVVGVKQAVGQVVKAVQQKASREEVAGLIANRLTEMENLLNGMLEDDRSHMALAFKCLSCGHNSLQRKRGNNPGTAPGAGPTSEQESLFHDDASSLASMDTRAIRNRANRSREVSHKNDETSILLSELKQQNAELLISNELRGGPLNPVNPPPNRHQFLKKNSQDTAPLYRRARNANYLKEVIKIPTQVPMTASKALLYHLDDELDTSDVSSMHSRSVNGLLDNRWNPLSQGKTL